MNVQPQLESSPELPEDFEAWIADNRTRVANDVDWRDRLKQSKEGGTLPSLSNAATVLRYHEAWRDVIGYDEFSDTITKLKPPPWDPADAPANESELAGEWSDKDTSRAKAWLERKEGMQVGVDLLDKAIDVVAATSTFHPVRDYLNGLKWDGVPRLSRMLFSYFNVDPGEYEAGVGKRWMISAVARIMEPGCQVDCVLVLEGSQGIGKSTGLKALCGNPKWFSDAQIAIGDKDSYQSLRNVWIFCLDELDSLKRSELTRTKSFISSQVDRYRPSFGRRALNFPRQCVFAGTTNEEEYLADPTGNRRFWPVMVRRKIDVERIREDRDQLWAEAVVCYRAKHPWYVDTPEFQKLCEEAQAKRTQTDPWVEKIAEWVKMPRYWETYRPFEIGPEGVLVSDILLHALGKRLDGLTRFDHIRVAQILRGLGYERGPQKREAGARIRRYLKVSPVTSVTSTSI